MNMHYVFVLLVHDSIYAERAICYHLSVRLSVRPSVRHTGGSAKKRLKLIFWNFYRTVAPSTSFCGISFIQKFWLIPHERERQTREGRENKQFSSFMRQYLEIGKRYVHS